MCGSNQNGEFAFPQKVSQTIAATHQRKADTEIMATDYDSPRKGEEEHESLQALQEREEAPRLSLEVDDADNPDSLEMSGQDLAGKEFDVVVLPPQKDEFTCMSCFLVKHRSQIAREGKKGELFCIECEG